MFFNAKDKHFVTCLWLLPAGLLPYRSQSFIDANVWDGLCLPLPNIFNSRFHLVLIVISYFHRKPLIHLEFICELKKNRIGIRESVGLWGVGGEEGDRYFISHQPLEKSFLSYSELCHNSSVNLLQMRH